MQINLRQLINPAFKPFMMDKSRNLVLIGGAGSGKSVFVTQKLVIRVMREPGHSIIAFRKIGATLRDSVFAEFRSTISMFGVSHLWRENKTEMSFTFLPNGGRIRCMGLDDQEKLKSVARLTSVWMEEATEFVPKDYEQINLRLRGKPAKLPDGRDSYRQIIVSFNPISSLHWLKKFFFDQEQNGRTTTFKSTYLDNIFIDPEYKIELEALAERDPVWAAVYCRGEWGVLEGAIFKPFINCEAYPKHFTERIYGLDFGFNAPSALIEVGIYDEEYYLTERIYGPGMTTGDLVLEMDRLGISKNDPIYCDAAEPDRIEEIYRAGYNAKPANKKQGSVKAGIDLIRKSTVYTNDGNANLNAENNTYSWKQNKNGDYLDEPEKANDHAMDATRYAVDTHNQREDAGAGGAELDIMPE